MKLKKRDYLSDGPKIQTQAAWLLSLEHYVLSLILASGLVLTAGPRPEGMLWPSSQSKGRSVILRERILRSYSAGPSIHLIKEGPQNINAFGDSKSVFTTHEPYKCFLKLFKACSFDQSALRKHYLTNKVSQLTSRFPDVFQWLHFHYLVPPPPTCFLMGPVLLPEDVYGKQIFLP